MNCDRLAKALGLYFDRCFNLNVSQSDCLQEKDGFHPPLSVGQWNLGLEGRMQVTPPHSWLSNSTPEDGWAWGWLSWGTISIPKGYSYPIQVGFFFFNIFWINGIGEL